MPINLIALLKEQLTGDVVSKLSTTLGESTVNTKSALGNALPSILAVLVQKASNTNGSNAILDLVKKGNHDGSILDNLSGILGGSATATNTIQNGNSILNALLGDKLGGVASLIANISGISKASSSSVLGIAAPIVMGLLGKTMKQQGITSAAGLSSLLGGQTEFLKGALPAGLTGLLGLSGFGSVASMTSAPKVSESNIKKFFPLIGLALLAVLAWFLLRSCNKDVMQPVADLKQATQETVTSGKNALDNASSQVGDLVSTLGSFFTKKLPNGVELNIPEKGIEYKLLSFIEGSDIPVDKTTWFTFDRLTFETGKASLMPQSEEQLKNIAEILKAYPAVHLKIGGYTDNTGNPASNLKLSQARADNVMQTIVELGVDGRRLRAEGYGQDHPIADNNTEEGRAQNRRIDVRVTEK